jgi:hypothetical protein
MMKAKARHSQLDAGMSVFDYKGMGWARQGRKIKIMGLA